MRNKKIVVVVLSFLCSTSHLVAWFQKHSKQERHRTFMFTRPLNQNLAMNQATWHDYIYEKHGRVRSAFQLIGAAQESFESAPSNTYFLFNRKEILLIAGDQSPEEPDRDVRAEWLGLPANFSGTLQLRPHQRQIGVFLEFNQDLYTFCPNNNLLKDYWLDVCVSVVNVHNKLDAEQRIGQTTPDVFPNTILEGLNRPELLVARYTPDTTKTGIAEIKIKFGKVYMSEDDNQVIYYSGLSIPGSPHQSTEHVFDAFVGNNGHWGIVAGVGFQVALNRCDCAYSSCIFLNVENIFFIKTHQRRTLDLLFNPLANQENGFPESVPSLGLRHSPWSRYLTVNKKGGGPNQNIPAANILTQDVLVHPFAHVDATLGIRLLYEGWNCEMGWNVWAHGSERIELEHCFQENYGIAGTPNPQQPFFTTTASKSTIDVQAANDVDSNGNLLFVPIKIYDLDLRSGGTRKVYTNKVHISFGWGHKNNVFDGFFNVGGWYEVPDGYGALKLGGIWLKIGGAF